MEKDYSFILKYRELKTIGQVCKNLSIDYSNMINGKTSKENYKKVADELKRQVIELYSSIIVEEVIK